MATNQLLFFEKAGINLYFILNWLEFALDIVPVRIHSDWSVPAQ